MKRLITIVFFLLPLFLNAQPRFAPQDPAPENLILNSPIEKVADFNRYILSVLPEYRFKRVDTFIAGMKDVYTYQYTNSEGDLLKLVYSVRDKFGDPDLKQQPVPTVYAIELSGQYITQVKLYNNLFKTNYTPEDFRGNAKTIRHLNSKQKEIFYSIDSESNKPGYWRMYFK